MRQFYIFACLLWLLSHAVPAAAEDWLYTVRPGDTLWGLCEKYTVKKDCWLTIGPYNQVVYPKRLAPGTVVRFPAAWLKLKPAEVLLLGTNGSVWYFAPDQEERKQPAQVSQALSIGSSLETDTKASATIQFADGSLVYLGEKSRITFDKISSFGERGMVDATLYLQHGEARAVIQKQKSQRRFHIRTPSAVTAVRGTEFTITAEKSTGSITRTSVQEGLVNISNPKGDSDSAAGFGVITEKDKAPSEPKALLPAVDLGAIPDTVPNAQSISWPAIDGAANYKASLYQEEAADLLWSISTKKPRIQLPEKLSGCMLLAINAVDNEHLTGLSNQKRVCVQQKPLAWLTHKQSNGQLHLQWREAQSVTEYLVEIALTANFESILVSEKVSSNTLSLPGQYDQHFVRVTALKEAKPAPIAKSSTVKITQTDERPMVFTLFSAFVLFLVL